MRSFWLDPYLWVHLAGVAVVPIALEGCLLGLAASNSLLPPWMELLLVGSLGAAPILWMQWQRPFCIYSLMFLALQPRQLTEDQRRILRRFQSPLGKGLSLVTAGVLLSALWQIYQIAPIAWESASIVPGGALGGLLLAGLSFLFANLFLQVPVSVAQVMLTDERTIAATEPYPINAVARDFTLFGIRVNQILPSLKAEPALSTAGVSVPPQAVSSQKVSSQNVSSQAVSSQTLDRKGDRPAKTAPTRFKDPQPSPSSLQTSAEAAAKPTEQTTPKPKRPVIPVEVIDAEFRELGTDDEWDEVIVSEEESLTDDPRSETSTEADTLAEVDTLAEADTLAAEATHTGTSHPNLSEIAMSEADRSEADHPATENSEADHPATENLETDRLEAADLEANHSETNHSEIDHSEADHSETISAETIAQTATGTEFSIAPEIDQDTVSGTETDTDSEIAPDTIAPDANEETIADSTEFTLPESTLPEFTLPESISQESIDDLAGSLPAAEMSALAELPVSPQIPEITATPAIEELLQPIPEPIEELTELNQTRLTGEEDLLISAMTLIESEDVSEGAAVDIPAVEVVTAEIVEDVSEDAAVPAETIETWLEEDWEQEVTG